MKELIYRQYAKEDSDGPEPGKGYFTINKKKIKGSDFDVPKGTNDVELKGRLDPDTGEPYIEELGFTKDSKSLGSVKPPKGTRPNDVDVTPHEGDAKT